MNNTIIEGLSDFISNQILKQPERVIDRSEKIISSGLIDSFSLVDLSIYIEESFGVRIEDTELNADTFDTLDELVQLIEQRH